MSEAATKAKARTNEEMLTRLRVIEMELFDYAYGKDEIGHRFAAWEEIATAGAAINRAIEEIEQKVGIQ